MSIAKINNIHLLSSQSFKGSESSSKRGFSDEEMIYIASNEPNRRFVKVSKNFRNTMIALPIVDSVASFIAKSGNLSAKTKAATLTANMWAFVGLAAVAVNSVKKFVNSNSKLLDDFNREHAFVSSVIDFGAIFGALKLGLNVVSNVSNAVLSKHRAPLSKFYEKYISNTFKRMDASKLNKKFIIPFESYKNSHPVTSKAIKLASLLVVPTMLVAATMRYVAEAKHRNRSIADNYMYLQSFNQIDDGDKEDK